MMAKCIGNTSFNNNGAVQSTQLRSIGSNKISSLMFDTYVSISFFQAYINYYMQEILIYAFACPDHFVAIETLIFLGRPAYAALTVI